MKNTPENSYLNYSKTNFLNKIKTALITLLLAGNSAFADKEKQTNFWIEAWYKNEELMEVLKTEYKSWILEESSFFISTSWSISSRFFEQIVWIRSLLTNTDLPIDVKYQYLDTEAAENTKWTKHSLLLWSNIPSSWEYIHSYETHLLYENKYVKTNNEDFDIENIRFGSTVNYEPVTLVGMKIWWWVTYANMENFSQSSPYIQFDTFILNDSWKQKTSFNFEISGNRYASLKLWWDYYTNSWNKFTTQLQSIDYFWEIHKWEELRLNISRQWWSQTEHTSLFPETEEDFTSNPQTITPSNNLNHYILH